MKTIRIFISSPGDVGRERELARRIVARVEASFGQRVKLEPYLWEHEPMRSTADFQQNILDPAEFDIVVCILWSRLGSRLHSQHRRTDGTRYASGTEYEFERAVEGFRLRGSPDLLIYRRQELPLLPPEPKERLLELSNQWEALKAFCERWFKDVQEGTFSAAYNSYTNLSEFEEHFEKHLRKIITEKLGKDPKSGSVVSAGLVPTWKGESPYRGLKVFDFEHDAIFFGRTKATDDILGALRKRSIEDNCPFVLILGASGSGKSSLLRAGVLPLLVRPGVIDGIGMWRRLVLRPSEAVGDLFKGFAIALLSSSALPELGADGTTADQLATMMRQAPAGVGLLLKEALSRAAREMQLAEKLERQPVARLAVALDQLEELFTDSRLDTEQQRTFFQAMSVLARSGYAWVIATLRSDFYHRCEELPELVELTRGAGQYHLLPPTAAELGQMIRLPAEAAGRRFEDHPEKGRLDDLIRDTALREPGALPLLEFALDELYRAAQSGAELTHADYEKIGGVEGALAKQADKRFEDLSEVARQAFEPVFQRLVSLGKVESPVAEVQTDGLAAVRQTVSLEEVRACSTGAAELVDGLIAGRLLVTDRAKEGGTVVTVSHEALLRSWGRLRQWIADHREMLELRAEVASAEDAWHRAGRKTDYLLVAGLPLEKARQVQAAGFLNEAQNEFVNASINKAKRRTRMILATVSTLLLVFVCLSVFAVSQWIRAGVGERKAKQAASQAEFNLACKLLELGENREAYARLAYALRLDPDNKVAAAMGLSCIEMQTIRRERINILETNAFTFATYSPDGRAIVTASRDGTARIWDAMTGQSIGHPLQHAGEVWSAVFSPDGRYVVTASPGRITQIWDVQTGQAQIWDVQTGQRVGETFKHTGSVYGATYSPDGHYLVTAGWGDNCARIWDTQTGQSVGSLPHPMKVRYAAYSPDGRYIVTSCWDFFARIWDAKTGELRGKPLKHDNRVYCSKFSPSGRYVLTCSLDATARLWDVETCEQVGLPLQHSAGVRWAAFSPDERSIVTACRDGNVRVWDVATRQLIGSPLRHNGMVYSAEFSPDGRYIVSASADNSVRIWYAATGQPAGFPLLSHSNAVNSAMFSFDGRYVVTACDDHYAQVWDWNIGRPMGISLRHGDKVRSASFSSDGRRVVTASDDRTARLWDVQTGLPIGRPMSHDDKVGAARFSHDGKHVVTASSDFTAQIWDAETGNPVGTPLRMQRDMQPVYDAEFSPDDHLLILASGDSARIWDVTTRWPVSQPLQHDDLVYSAAFSPDGKRVVTASLDHTARIWDAVTGKPASLPLQHNEPVNCAAFSPDGRYVVTACDDHTARIWDVATGRPFGLPLRHAERVNSAAFSPDGRYVVTACKDRTAQIWDVDYMRITAGTYPESRRILTPLLEAISETKIVPQTDAAIRSPDDLHSLQDQLISRPDTLRAYHEVLVWYFSDPSIRSVWPGSAYAVPQLIAGLRRINRSQVHQAAYELNPSDPLTLLTVAGDENDPVRKTFQRRFAIQRLPNDIAAYTNAIDILKKQEDEVLARELLEQVTIKFPRVKELQSQ